MDNASLFNRPWPGPLPGEAYGSADFCFQGSPEIPESCWKCQSFPEIQPPGFTTGSEDISLSPAAPHASLSSNFTWRYRTVPAGLTPCLWPKNKGQANNTRLLQWVTHNQQNRCKDYILRDLGCLCSSRIAFTHSSFWKLYKPSAFTDQLPKLCFLNFSCYLWTAGSMKLPINSLQSNLANLRRVCVNLMARYNGLTDQ